MNASAGANCVRPNWTRTILCAVTAAIFGSLVLIIACGSDDDDPPTPETYLVTVTGGTGSGNQLPGANVTITASAPPAGFVFDSWTSVPTVPFTNANSATTMFIMPSYAVQITAIFVDPNSMTTLCGATPFDPVTEFCFGTVVVAKCGGNVYNPSTHTCQNGTLVAIDVTTPTLCGTTPYDPSTHVCQNGTLVPIATLCGNTPYNPATHTCENGTLVPKTDPPTPTLCGGEEFNSATHVCVGDVTYPKCGTGYYDPEIEFCFSGTKYTKCGGEVYDPPTQFCDARAPATIYNHVTIGTQVWMAENLNYNAAGSRCYGDDEENCDTYGRLYDWVTAMNIASTYSSSEYTVTGKHQGVCPAGWHLPSSSEWDMLITTVGPSGAAGGILKAQSGWDEVSGNGTDVHGFTALPAGFLQPPSFFDIGKSTYWWGTDNTSSGGHRRYIRNGNGISRDIGNKANGLSVRCVRD